MNFKLITENSNYYSDFMTVVTAFEPKNDVAADDALKLELNIYFHDGAYRLILKCDDYNSYYYENEGNLDELGPKSHSYVKRKAKISLYDLLSEITGKTLPYGSLTGIRPTKLYRETLESGIDADEYFVRELNVSRDKTCLIKSIVDIQKDVYIKDDGYVDVFINIPFCISRCSYCSFISAEIGKVRKLIPRYVDILCKEIAAAKDIVAENGYLIRSLYIGGGTPTSLDDSDLAQILRCCAFGCPEFTVEAGRPDTITRGKLELMKECGVTRISINPQSFHDKTLKAIGRNHTVADIYKVFKMAKEYDFIINADLIAMLPGEGLPDFQYSVDECVKLRPDNITVHTLALKKGSDLKNSAYDNDGKHSAEAMIDYSASALSAAGYSPYYMYRQKHMSGNLENTGYCRDGTICLYNVDIMEESCSIIACGAGAISKRLYAEEDRLERLANPKGPDVYLERADDIIYKKRAFFARNERNGY